METWVYLTLLATLIYGVMNFLFKAAAERNLDADLVVSVTGGTVAVLSFLTILVSPRNLDVFTRQVGLFALMNGLAFGLASLCKFAALKRAPAAVVFPVNRLNTVLVMIIGFVVFKDSPEPLQYVGMAMAFGVILLIVFERGGQNVKFTGSAVPGVFFSLASALLTAFSMTVGKFVAESSADRVAFICCSYSLVFAFTVSVYGSKKKERPYYRAVLSPPVLLLGILIGSLNYAGYFLVLQAFGSGPLSLVQAIFSTSIILPILLAYVVYKEQLTPNRIAAVALAIVAVILISR